MHGPLPFACKLKDSPQAFTIDRLHPLGGCPHGGSGLGVADQNLCVARLAFLGAAPAAPDCGLRPLLAAVSLVLAALLIILVHLSS